MGDELQLLLDAVVSGVMVGGFYAAAAIGITIAFGLLDIVNIAHPGFIVAGAFVAYFLNTSFGLDPLVSAAIAAPLSFLVGRLLYRNYYHAFEKHGEDSLQGLAFFFGILFIVEVALLLVFGVDYRSVEAPYIGPTLSLGSVTVATRLLVPLVTGLLVVAAIQVFLRTTFVGRTILAVSQDPGALRLVGGDPVWTKEIAFGLSIATAVIAGCLLIIIQAVEPSIGREYIGRVFAICVLGGMMSLTGTVVASMILGIAESITTIYFGPSWAPAVSFGFLLLALTVRPSGMFAR